MSTASHTPHPAEATSSRIRRIRRRNAKDPKNWNLKVAAARTSVPVKTVEASPMLMMVAVEDLCWQLGVAEVQARKPRPWQRGRRGAWRAEMAQLEVKRARLAELALEEINAL